MRHVFVFDKVAVIVAPWHEPMSPPERGARVEVRLVADEPHRGTRSAAQRLVVDQPLFRADLFDQVDQPAGNLASAHFHPRFRGVEPCPRTWPDELRTAPTAWLADQLGDLSRLADAAGVDVGSADLDEDAAALRAALPDVLAAVEATWAQVRAEPVAASG